MKFIFSTWTLEDEAKASLEAMKKRYFWQKMALIDGQFATEALKTKIAYTEKILLEAEENKALRANP